MREERANVLVQVGRWVQQSIPPDFAEESLEKALANSRAAQQVQRAAEEVRRAADAEVERLLGGNYYKSGPHVFVVSSSGSWKIIDREKAWNFVRSLERVLGFPQIMPLLDLATRKKAWEALSERAGLDPEKVLSDLLERHWSPPSLKLVPLDEAPDYVQKAPEGLVAKRKRSKGGDK